MHFNYPQRFCVAAYRKKTTLLVVSGLSVLILFGLEYSRLEENKISELMKEERDAQVVADALMKSINVKFIETAKRINKDQDVATKIVTELDEERLSKLEQPSRDEIARRRAAETVDNNQFEILETEQQLGIPYVNLDPKNPYIPKKRIVHLDLKGAPPILSYFRKLFPLIKVMGATGVLLEYEDMFPFSGALKNISAKNAFTAYDVSEILKLAEESKLEVIPLVQTFGHVEFALKHSEFSHLREVPGSPQALCPSRASSLNFIREVMDLHPNTKYLHIGCDEVFQMGECDVCRLEMHENLFLKHVKTVADIVHARYPHVRVIVWDDMLRHISQQAMLEINIGNLVEPMVWVYAEDIYRFVQPTVWDKYADVFKTAWTASAFKGAFGETLYVPNAKRHLENNLRWLDVMATQASAFKQGLMGIVITGWQRYDHFSVLCELLPASIPSLALNLITVTYGYFNSSLKEKFLSALSCPMQNMAYGSPFISLDADPFLWDKLSRCMFPGNSFFRLTNRLHNLETEAREYLDITKRQKGWMTSYNVRHNYSLPLRVDELTSDLPRIYHGMVMIARSAVDAMVDVFDNYTISEWIEQRIYPYIIELEQIQNQSIALKSVNHWPARPLPPLRDLQRLGVTLN
ncbi:hypothetical protein NQ315_013116 [Exocentrus adspersus]|uniref:beta-N-acetylhexosaminidase n=1 Tax=Exocentrus adspersus TaxID=1586481 RepID=A0AAV8VWM2_9CUCU|nr:hypothetical protein NQ315_013116 [Exocentrus adspersus]